MRALPAAIVVTLLSATPIALPRDYPIRAVPMRCPTAKE